MKRITTCVGIDLARRAKHKALVVGADEAQRIAQGQSVEGPPLPAGDDKAPLCRAYSLAGDFLAVMVYDNDARRWRPKKVFAPAQI